MLAAASNVYFAPKKPGQCSRHHESYHNLKTLHEIEFDFPKRTYIFTRFSYHFKQSEGACLGKKKFKSAKNQIRFHNIFEYMVSYYIELIFKAKQIDNGVIQPSTILEF